MLRVACVSTFATLAFLLTSSLLFAETDEARMKRSYHVTPRGAFIIEPGATAKAVFDEHGGACTFTLFGEMSEDKVLETFDMLVPTEKRGSNKAQEMLECIGSCLRIFSYQNVTLVTGSVGEAISDPAAIIRF